MKTTNLNHGVWFLVLTLALVGPLAAQDAQNIYAAVPPPRMELAPSVVLSDGYLGVAAASPVLLTVKADTPGAKILVLATLVDPHDPGEPKTCDLLEGRLDSKGRLQAAFFIPDALLGLEFALEAWMHQGDGTLSRSETVYVRIIPPASDPLPEEDRIIMAPVNDVDPAASSG